jgi:hypothetical protein
VLAFDGGGVRGTRLHTHRTLPTLQVDPNGKRDVASLQIGNAPV